MELSKRQSEAGNLVEKIAQHLRNYPCDLRHARKLMRHFHASATDIEQAINQVATPLTFHIDPTETRHKVLLHFLHYPGDIIDIRRIMQQLHASECDVQQALDKLALYYAEGGEDEVHADIDKE